VVWGGESGVNRSPQDGAAYDPSTDRWRPLPPPPVDLGTRDHSMIWTGTEVVIWSGSVGSGPPTNRGARWDPITNTWTRMSTQRVPEGRVDAQVVWIGDRLLVWGGTPESGYLRGYNRDGALYDPMTDRWEPISLDGAPIARDGTHVHWTGRELLLWGGSTTRYPTYKVLNWEGFAFDPDQNRWRRMPDVDLAKREAFVSAWTGEELLLFGGDIESDGQSNRPIHLSYANDGARYRPPC
jgi:hypothetical protein